MPHASLLVMTSPMLLGSGQLPAVSASAVVEVSEPTAKSVQFEAQNALPILPLNWSLTSGQDEQTVSGTPLQDDEQEGSTAENGEPEIVVEGDYGPPSGDPIAAVNEASYAVAQGIDSAFVEPAADVYRDALPDPLRDGVGNFVRNLREPSNFLNFLLQLKVGDAFETLGRFAINSTIGVGGLFDVAGSDAIGLPYRQNGFANTMGYYGIGNGTYLFVPIAGPTTLRDLIGNTLDQALLPTIIGRPYTSPEYAIPLFVVANLDSRVELDEELERIGETIDPYATRRDLYLWRRERDIALLKGEEPPPRPEIVREIEEGVDFDDEEEEFIGDAPPVMEESASDPSISYVDVLEMPAPQLAAAVAITVPRTR